MSAKPTKEELKALLNPKTRAAQAVQVLVGSPTSPQGVERGGTGSNLSDTGGPGYVVMQEVRGGPFTVGPAPSGAGGPADYGSIMDAATVSYDYGSVI